VILLIVEEEASVRDFLRIKVVSDPAQRTERWRPRRLAWLRLAASRARSKMSFATGARSVIAAWPIRSLICSLDFAALQLRS
jgi:hypothetical protein